MSLILLTYENIISPAVLLFLFGFFASKLRSNLNLPEAMTQAIGYYFIFAIGFRSGVELVRHPLNLQALATLLTAFFFSFNLPFLVFFTLRRFAKELCPVDAVAISAHYGSVSFVTFVAAASFLSLKGVDYESYLVVAIMMMETPPIVAALLIKNHWLHKNHPERQTLSTHLRQFMFPGSSLLLAGSFIVGAVTGNDGALFTHGFLIVPFQGILCFFLLNIGLIAGRQLNDYKRLSRTLMWLALLLPLCSGLLGLGAAYLLELSVGGSCLFAILCASASYIVVPSVMRVGLPEADHSLAITLALGVTFPFNMIVGIPLFYWLSQLMV